MGIGRYITVSNGKIGWKKPVFLYGQSDSLKNFLLFLDETLTEKSRYIWHTIYDFSYSTLLRPL